MEVVFSGHQDHVKDTLTTIYDETGENGFLHGFLGTPICAYYRRYKNANKVHQPELLE